jgi:molecular chaperone HtpG
MTAQKMEFRTEVRQLMDLMINSLYSHKEVFLRELISNASDAIDKARYQSLTDDSVLEDEKDFSIRISADKAAGTLTVSDNGIGMTRDEAVEALGTIAHSGTRNFIELLKDKDAGNNPELIGQFGVGFYSSFMVADRITVVSRRAGHKGEKGVIWESGADGSFTVDEADKAGKGTDVILHLKEDEKKYLNEWEIRDVVRKYSDFIEHPVVMEVEREEDDPAEKGKKVKVGKDETLNSQKAIWLRDKASITDEEYNEFYRHISHDYGEPLKTLHYKGEGASEFSALLYLPARAPMNILYRDFKIGPALYVRRVKIMDNCEELIPAYLRFVRGVIDSSDLPLNVSREILQNNIKVETIKKSVTKKVLDMLAEMKKSEYDKYVKFHDELGRVLKEGVHLDFSRREAVADLLLFPSTRTEAGKHTSLGSYVEAMKEGQEDIYYICAESRDEALKSPHLEAFVEKGYDVLIMTDEIDDIIFSGFEYKGKKMKSVGRGDVSLDKTDKKEEEKKFGKLMDFLKEKLKDDVKDVRLSGRLKDSACCLVSDEGDVDPRLEKVMKAMGQALPASKRALEINPDHELFSAMNRAFEREGANDRLAEYASLLYDQALLLEGEKLKDPAAFAKALSRLMAESITEK